MTDPNTASSKDQFIVRFPVGMRDELKRLANSNRRSMNAELLLLIERGMAAGRIYRDGEASFSLAEPSAGTGVESNMA
jgi:hypothetical protein